MSTNPTLASAPGEHCFTAVKHIGTPVGSTEVIAEVETYVTLPPSSENTAGGKYDKVVLFFADVYGPFFVNNQLLVDYFASQGESLMANSISLLRY